MPRTFKDQIINKYLSNDIIVKVTSTIPRIFNVEFIDGNMAMFHTTTSVFIQKRIIDQISYEIDLNDQ